MPVTKNQFFKFCLTNALRFSTIKNNRRLKYKKGIKLDKWSS